MDISEKTQNIYMIGICGIAMGTLACMLKSSGFDVRGSDKNVYPPMSDTLLASGIVPDTGFDPSALIGSDLVIIGNAVSRGNPQVEYVLNRKMRYCSMADAIAHFFLKDKDVIAVSGTHGKTTTTALLAHILVTAGADPGFLIGGMPGNYSESYRIGGGKYFVIEGDEYDSSFFQKIPKFMYYAPRHLVLTSLEFDHADIYADLDEIRTWFRRLVNIIPSEGSISRSAAYPVLDSVVEKSFAPVSAFSVNGNGDVNVSLSRYDGEMTNLIISSDKCRTFSAGTRLFGDFNLANISGAVSAALNIGIEPASIAEALETFRGVRRRQQLLFSSDEVLIYEDFAHHPTAVSSVLSAMRERYPDASLSAVYEPRSATSRRNVFQNELPAAFSSADRVFIKTPYNLEAVPADQRIDITSVVEGIGALGVNAGLFDSVDDIVSEISESGISRKQVIVIMSNGGFGGIYKKLVSRFSGGISLSV